MTVTFADYDGLDRPTYKTYNDSNPTTPAVSYAYDTCTYGKGRLCSVSSGTAVTAYNYSSLGFISDRTQTQQTSPARPYKSWYSYHPAGSMTSIEYNTGTLQTGAKRVSYSYSQAGRVTTAYRGVHGGPVYAEQVGYWANGQEKASPTGIR